jgi:GT2 family glycosyltransferase
MPERKQTDQNDGAFKLLAVIVLYKMKPSDSASFNTLQKAISYLRHEQAEVKIVLYDNTPEGQDPGELSGGAQYKADVENGGVAKAYNYALGIAQEEGFDWLLSLDQDTSLPIDFMCKLYDAAMLVAPLHDVAAIAPSISSDGRAVSPFTLTKNLRLMRHFPDGFLGIPAESAYAINSAFTIKVGALEAIGGYDPRFSLDMCDLVIGHRLHCQNLRVYIAGNIRVEHELSVFDLMNRVDLVRYENIQRAEEAFYDEYLGRIEGIALLSRLFFRLIYKLWRAGATSPYFTIGLRYFCRRLFYSRKRRMGSLDALSQATLGRTGR